MKVKGKNKNNFTTYEISQKECKKLIETSEDAMKYTYPENGKGFTVALLTKNGKIFHGASYVSDTHNLTMHSEAVVKTPIF